MKHFSQFIREIISVIVGILIALVINNWNEERKDKEYLDRIYSSIEKELGESKADLERVIPKKMALLDSLNHHIDNTNKSIYQIVVSADGIHAPNIKTNSWNAIAASKIELIEYKRLSGLADIQERKENLKNRTEKLLEFLLQNFESTERQKKEIARFMVFDIIGAEERFQNDIGDLLETEFNSNSKQ